MQEEQGNKEPQDLTDGPQYHEAPAPGVDIILSDTCTQHDLLQAYHAAAAKLAMRGLRDLPVNAEMPALSDNRVTAINDNLYVVYGFDIDRANRATLERLRGLQTTPLPMTVKDGTYTLVHIDDGNGEDRGPSGVTIDDLLAIVQDQAERYMYIGRMGLVAGKVEELRKILREEASM